jgi:hypothetical protein
LKKIYNNYYNIIYLGFIIRLIIAVWNGFFGPSFGAEGDALNFHNVALDILKYNKDFIFSFGWIYSFFLSYIYNITVESLFIGSFISCITWLISAFYLSKIINTLEIAEGNKIKIFLFYSLMPSSIFYTSVTLREVYQLLFVNMSIYYIIFNTIKFKFVNLIKLLLTLVLLITLHSALIAVALFFILALIWLQSSKTKSYLSLNFLIGALILIISSQYLLDIISSLSYKLDDGLSLAIQIYQEGSLATEARAHYKDNVVISGIFGLIFFIPINFFQYLFEPMPWRITAPIDIISLIENLIRFYLITYSFINIIKLNNKSYKNKMILFILLSYLAIELIWSLGTTNWGTAMRHHIPSLGLLLIAAFSFSTNKILTK